jgi:hypothetical protein
MKSRPFGIVDAMLAVAPIAVGLWANRMDWFFIGNLWQKHVWPSRLCAAAFVSVGLALPYLAAGTVAWLFMRIRQPRPPLRRLARRPGTVACLTAVAAFTIILGSFAVTMAMERRVSLNLSAHNWRTGGTGSTVFLWAGRKPSGIMIVPWSDRLGFAVAGAWLALRASGRWSPERSWIDRLGRVLGWAWIVAAAIVWTLPFQW